MEKIKQNLIINEILTIADVAAFLRIHRSTVTRYAKSGELKSHLIGSRRLFKKEDVLTFFDNQESPEYVSRRTS
ncbi:helix-turn-helix domain-containing protein [Desulforhopalus singaporensis]|uniref:helix-turn-helix domain-containing protein n=1 Tax=Desulforhopalus singaporensis TaxID=91360 RepID=UPI000B8987C9|nr:helix-turn-helix domain-containing protein [Desulforhopalus singaporensis]